MTHLSQRTIFNMANELTNPGEGGVPGFLRKMSTGASFGNIDASDLKPPRLKLLAGQSPEVIDNIHGAQPGNFWVTILNQNLGPSVVGSPILLRKTYQIWAPKTPGSDQKGPLATASDGINWDVPDQKFEVKFYGNPRTYTWKIGKTVAEFNVTKFGSQQDDDKGSKPIATLTYDVLWLIDLPTGTKQLVVFTSARTGTKPTQNFISTVKAQGIDQFYQRYRITAKKMTGPTGDPYFSYDYQFVGTLENEEDAKAMRGLYDQYARSGFIVDMGEEADDIKTERHTQGSRRDYTDTRKNDDEDSIPF
jgi:hypothetical protein